MTNLHHNATLGPLGQILLSPASFAYAAVSHARAMAYRNGLLPTYHSEAYTLSIGNITYGGTGKTPLTINLASKFIKEGYKVGILSRGYKRRSNSIFTVVSNGEGRMASPEESGDEPYMMAQKLPEAIVVVGSRRLLTAQLATEQYGCDVLILDDGFQHLSVLREEDIVLIDYNDDLERNSCTPKGSLREPLSALSRASRFVITKIPQNPDKERLERLSEFLQFVNPQAIIGACSFYPAHLIRVGKTKELLPVKANLESLSALKGARVGVFAGIANPGSLVQKLEDLGAQVAFLHSFADHHWYDKHDLEKITREQKEKDAQFLVTTEKDAVRLNEELTGNLDIRALSLETKWLSNSLLDLPKR
jgi:tetraacyldisaccharide 4'-kinase